MTCNSWGCRNNKREFAGEGKGEQIKFYLRDEDFM